MLDTVTSAATMIIVGDAGGSLLARLVGKELASVIFVRDYLQVDFDGPRFSLFVWPRVVLGSVVLGAGDSGYRDALCSLIGRVVSSAEEGQAAGLVVNFDAGSLVTKPDPAELSGPEIALLNGFADGSDWMVWRPGESPFDGAEWS